VIERSNSKRSQSIASIASFVMGDNGAVPDSDPKNTSSPKKVEETPEQKAKSLAANEKAKQIIWGYVG